MLHSATLEVLEKLLQEDGRSRELMSINGKSKGQLTLQCCVLGTDHQHTRKFCLLWEQRVVKDSFRGKDNRPHCWSW